MSQDLPIPRIYLPILTSLGAKEYITRGTHKHVFATQDRNIVCKLFISRSNAEMGKVFRELLYRMHHPEICVVPRDIRIHNPRHTDVVMIVWKEERADEVGRESISIHKFIDSTVEQLNEHGFRDLHPRNVGRFGQGWKWFDL